MLRKQILAAIILGITLSGLSSTSAQNKPQVPKVRSEMLVSPLWLNAHLRDRNLVILHIGRERSQFEAGHIPGARFLPWSELVETRDGIINELPPVEKLQALFTSLGVGNSGRIILYGDSSGLAAARAYFTLDYLGHGARCALLDGGLERWKADGREVSTIPVQADGAEFTPRLAPSAVTNFPVMRDYSWIVSEQSPKGISILDSRPENQYRGEGASGAGRSGHIPGATNLYWMKHLESAENPVMRPVSEIRKMFAEAGIQPGDKVITYCNSGVQASHSYFTAKYLGYDVSLYDGSFSEWSRIESTRIVTGANPK